MVTISPAFVAFALDKKAPASFQKQGAINL
jgi:hypothetical protein